MPEIATLREQIAWAYANLAQAHAAKEAGVERYKPVHYAIRNRLFSGLTAGTLSMRTLCDDERLKMTLPQCCVYCGSKRFLSLDHLIPKKKNGSESSDNIVWACRSCNSSKSDKDLIEWFGSRGDFPSIFILRRYLKLIFAICEERNILDIPFESIDISSLPFSASSFPLKFPRLRDLVLWVSDEGGGCGSIEPRFGD